ncbi:MAG TPA: hypothetical protein VMD91_08205 [Candidatus Sulfotelmatobacter sp.]|nr:hypothetical protein [Candidatus Sulfotelmatobacter sp.]
MSDTRSLVATACALAALLMLPVGMVLASVLVRDALAPLPEEALQAADTGRGTPRRRDDLPFGFVV